jgi:hypothetical protein
MTPGQQKIIERLRQGPLNCKDPEGLAVSMKSLHVQIHKLRALGFRISTTRLARQGVQGSTPGTYVLEGEPTEKETSCSR